MTISITIRNQISNELIEKRFNEGCKSIKTDRGTDIESDHVLYGSFQMKLKKVHKKLLVKNFK